MTNFCEIEQLVKLFNSQKEDDSDSEDDQQSYPTAEKPTENAKQKQPKPKKPNPYDKLKPEPQKSLPGAEEYDDYLQEEVEKHKTDWKVTPNWDISYRQQVSAEDVFLQMGFKTPSTSSCEDMIVVVHMPGEHQKNMDLKILPQRLTLTSPKFHLDIPLPQPVDPQKGNAQFDKDTEKLTVTLKMDRELDPINF